MSKVIPTDIYEDGDLTKIEFYDEAGDFVIQAMWDDEDEQNSENRVHFRSWAYRMVEQLGYEVLN